MAMRRFMNVGKTPPIVGYDRKTKKIFILLSDDDDYFYDGGFTYDMGNNSWTRTEEIVKAITNKGLGVVSNMITINDGSLLYASKARTANNNVLDQSTTFKYYVEPPATATSGLGFVEFKTKDIDFGDIGVRKKVYKVYVTYKSPASSSNMQAVYYTNGDTSTAREFKAGDNVTMDTHAEFDGSKSQWTTAVLTPATSSQANNIYSFQLKFLSGTGQITDKDFEINDITIVFRKKPPK